VPLLRRLFCPDGKKAEKLPELSATLLTPDANDPEATVLELDELWSFVLKKTNKAWIWIALCRKTRQVVASAIGDRSEQTCRILWEAIPQAYRAGHCSTDFWAAYQAVIPEEQHTAVGKQTGETARARALEEHASRNGWLVSFETRSLSQNLC
jgi:insertion element IS1 protein InsB